MLLQTQLEMFPLSVKDMLCWGLIKITQFSSHQWLNLNKRSIEKVNIWVLHSHPWVRVTCHFRVEVVSSEVVVVVVVLSCNPAKEVENTPVPIFFFFKIMLWPTIHSAKIPWATLLMWLKYWLNNAVLINVASCYRTSNNTVMKHWRFDNLLSCCAASQSCVK